METLGLYLPAIAAPVVALIGYAIARASHRRMCGLTDAAAVRGSDAEQVAGRLDEIMKAESALADALKKAATRIERAAANPPQLMERL